MRVLVTCGEEAVADAAALAIGHALGTAVVASGTALERVHEHAATDRPDVIVLEHRGGDATWPAPLVQLRHAWPRARVLLLSDACTSAMVMEFIRLGASGWLPKGSPGAMLARGVVGVHAGEPWFGRRELFDALRGLVQAQPPGAVEMCARTQRLTPREGEILALIGDGMSNKEIGRYLKISDHTVKTHLHRVYVKLQQSGRYKAFVCSGGVPLAIRCTPRAGLLPPRFAAASATVGPPPSQPKTLARD